MTASDQLYLHEEAMLLALRDREGTIDESAFVQTALGASLMGEFLLRECIRPVPDDSEGRVQFVREADFGGTFVGDALEMIRTSKKDMSAGHWVGAIAAMGDLIPSTARSLCDRGVLREDKEKVALIFTRKTYPEIDPKPEREILDRLEHAIFTDDPSLDARTTLLVALCHHTGLLNSNFDKKRLADRKEHIEAVIQGSFASDAARAAIEAAQAAFFFTVIMPAVILPRFMP